MTKSINIHPFSTKSNTKTKKCLPAARDTPDLIQTECVPDSWQTRQHKKTNITTKSKYQNLDELKIHPTRISSTQKTKKCLPAARDTPDLIQTVCVPDSWQTRQHKKINKTQKQNACNTSLVIDFMNESCHTAGNVEIVENIKPNCTKQPSLSQQMIKMVLQKSQERLEIVKEMLSCAGKPTSSMKTDSINKTKKCQPAARDTPDLIQTECVPDSWLTRPNKKNITERKNYKIPNEITLNAKCAGKPTSSMKTGSINKTKKCQPAARDTPDLIQTECVPDSWLTRPNKKKYNRTKKLQNTK